MPFQESKICRSDTKRISHQVSLTESSLTEISPESQKLEENKQAKIEKILLNEKCKS